MAPTHHPPPRWSLRRFVLLLALGLAISACTTDRSAGNAGAIAGEESPHPPPFTILWLGDTLLADAAQPSLDANGYDWPFQRLATARATAHNGALDADFTIVNLEGPVTTDPTLWDPDQRWSYNAQPAAADALAAVGVDATGLANNHALDRGPQGITDTIDTLAAAGIQTFGAGLDSDAKMPLLIDTPHGIVAVVASHDESEFGHLASPERAGTLVPTTPAILRGLALARQVDARWVIADVHWGSNYTDIDEQQRRTARRLAAPGYDLVIGHGAHLAQPIEFVDGVPVFYSLGNFVFGTPGRYTPAAPGLSILLTTVVGPNGIHAATILCLLTDNDAIAFQPQLCPADQARMSLRGLHPAIELSGDLARLTWRPHTPGSRLRGQHPDHVR